MSTFEIAQISTTVVGSLLLFAQLYILFRSYKADHERRKKQSTIEAVERIDQRYLPIYEPLNKELKGAPVDPSKIDAKVDEQVSEILTALEYIAVGVNCGIYDETIVMRMTGKYYIDIFIQLQRYINAKRVNTNNQFYYNEFEELCRSLQKLDEPPKLLGRTNARGNLQFS